MTESIYQRGQIYSIRSHQTDLIYIGSTTQPLHKRFAQHKGPSNKCSSAEIIKYEDAYIELLEDYPCDSKKALNKREGYLIRNMDCVNKAVPGRTDAEYYAENREQLKAYQAEYRAEHREQIKIYKAENREQINAKQAKYQAEHREQINAKKAEYRAKKKAEALNKIL